MPASSVWTHQPYGHQATTVVPRRFTHNPYTTPVLTQPIEETLGQGIHLLDLATGLLLEVDCHQQIQGIGANQVAGYTVDQPVRLVIGQLPNKKAERAAVVRQLVLMAGGMEPLLTGPLSMKMPGPFIAKITVPFPLATKLWQLSDRYHALTATFVPGPARPISVQLDPQ